MVVSELFVQKLAYITYYSFVSYPLSVLGAVLTPGVSRGSVRGHCLQISKFRQWNQISDGQLSCDPIFMQNGPGKRN